MDISKIVINELETEAKAILQAIDNLSFSEVEKAINMLYECKGKIIVCGMGKSGIIAQKIAATLSSTGSTSIFLHAAEAYHGDLGMVQKNDVVIAISYSGNTQEILAVLPFIKLSKVPIIALCGNINSKLAMISDIFINCFVKKEYEQFGLVPTASTTLTLALGDAIAVALLKKKGFEAQDFAKFHPGGTIGKKLLFRVKDLMHIDEKIPLVFSDLSLSDAILEINKKSFGAVMIIDKQKKLMGIITDGDLRRVLLNNKNDKVLDKKLSEFILKYPKYVLKDTLAVDTLNLMEDNEITVLPVIDEEKKVIGIIHMHDLIKAGIVG